MCVIWIHSKFRLPKNNDNFVNQTYFTDQQQQCEAISFASPIVSNSNNFKFQATFPNQKQQYNTEHINKFIKTNSSASPITTNIN